MRRKSRNHSKSTENKIKKVNVTKNLHSINIQVNSSHNACKSKSNQKNSQMHSMLMVKKIQKDSEEEKKREKSTTIQMIKKRQISINCQLDIIIE